MAYKVVFISNYINHHQIPFCNAMYKLLEGDFAFIQTEPMEQERVQMGWQQEVACPYLKLYYEEPDACKKWIAECEVAVFGGTDDESYIVERLKAKKPVIRYSERLYREGQWKAVSPRGLLKKYRDHTKYRKDPVYLLCSGAYVPSDFHIVRAYPKKMFCWGYFTETKHYDVDKLLEEKGWAEAEQTKNRIPYLLWTARLIELKHPELPLQAAAHLKEKGLKFHLDMVGGGVMEEEIRELVHSLHLEDCVSLVGYLTPDQVRSRMEKADIFLFTSDRHEGWGAVANESMNSGCALVADHMIGSTPFLIKQGVNGYAYEDGNQEMLFKVVEDLVRNPDLCKKLGRSAYETITKTWNAENAAQSLLGLMNRMVNEIREEKRPGENRLSRTEENRSEENRSEEKHLGEQEMTGLYPCAPAPVISERAMWKRINRPAK